MQANCAFCGKPFQAYPPKIKEHRFCSKECRRESQQVEKPSSEHKAWENVKQRCTNPKCPAYPNYGGRGIGICKEWDRFPEFLRDMGKKPSSLHTLERRDNSLGYDASNCYWATRHTQSKNRRLARLIEVDGETKNICDWSKMFGIKAGTIRARIDAGWTDRDAVLTPLLIDRAREHPSVTEAFDFRGRLNEPGVSSDSG